MRYTYLLRHPAGLLATSQKYDTPEAARIAAGRHAEQKGVKPAEIRKLEVLAEARSR